MADVYNSKRFDVHNRKAFQDYKDTTQTRIREAVEEFAEKTKDKFSMAESGGYWMIGYRVYNTQRGEYSKPLAHKHSIVQWSTEFKHSGNQVGFLLKNPAINPYSHKLYVKYLVGEDDDSTYASTQVPREQMLANFAKVRKEFKEVVKKALLSRRKV